MRRWTAWWRRWAMGAAERMPLGQCAACGKLMAVRGPGALCAQCAAPAESGETPEAAAVAPETEEGIEPAPWGMHRPEGPLADPYAPDPYGTAACAQCGAAPRLRGIERCERCQWALYRGMRDALSGIEERLRTAPALPERTQQLVEMIQEKRRRAATLRINPVVAPRLR